MEEAAKLIQLFSSPLRNDESRPVCLGNDVSYDGFHGSNKFYCGSGITNPEPNGTCGPSAGPQCDSCRRLSESETGLKTINIAAVISNDEGRKAYLGNDIHFPGNKGSDKFYCGCPIAARDANGMCGPSAGPQCDSCARLTTSAQRFMVR